MTTHAPMTGWRETALPKGEAWSRENIYGALMARAVTHSPRTLALAGVIAERWQGARSLSTLPIVGLDAVTSRRLLECYFPGTAAVLAVSWEALAYVSADAEREDETEDLIALLSDHRVDDEESTRWIAHAVATACMGENHLWQDMGLPNRQTLSSLLKLCFPSLAAKNTGDMKWKKFFYKQLCERAEIFICKAPSCGVCVDYAKCFGPEE